MTSKLPGLWIFAHADVASISLVLSLQLNDTLNLRVMLKICLALFTSNCNRWVLPLEGRCLLTTLYSKTVLWTFVSMCSTSLGCANNRWRPIALHTSRWYNWISKSLSMQLRQRRLGRYEGLVCIVRSNQGPGCLTLDRLRREEIVDRQTLNKMSEMIKEWEAA